MGFRNFGSLIMIFLILMMIFGTQRLRDVGNDLAVAIRSFRKGLQEDLNEAEGKENKEVKGGQEKIENNQEKIENSKEKIIEQR